MIIVEGPDNAGKSTLVKELCKVHNLTEGKRGTDNRDDLWKVTVADTHRALQQAVSPKHHPAYVWDRLFFSEFVYSKYVGRACEFSDRRKEMILEQLEDLACPIILCLPPKHVVLEPNDRHQMKGVNENLEAIYDDYVEMMDWMPPQTVFYNYKAESTERIHKVVGYYLRKRAERS